MILSDFVFMRTEQTGIFNRIDFAEVTVTTETGFWFWKKKHSQRRIIARKYPASIWYFVDNGQYCPGNQAEELSRSYMAKALILDTAK